MSLFHLQNDKDRDATVQAQTVRRPLRVRWLDPEGRQATSVRLLRSTLSHDVPALTQAAGSVADISELLLRADPEVDIETFGRQLRSAQRVFVSEDGEPVHQVHQVEVLYGPDGTERERRPRKRAPANINLVDAPIRFSARRMKKSEIYNRFIFSSKRQLVHTNGLTYDFLFGIAKELEEADQVLLVGAGPRGNEPILLTRGATPCRGFLEGRTDGDRYCLILHLTNQELKAPPREEAAS